MVDTGDILNSEFGDFSVSYAPAQWMKDVAQFFEDLPGSSFDISACSVKKCMFAKDIQATQPVG